MRALVLLSLAAAALAEDRFPMHVKVFDAARRTTLEPGAQAKVYPALEALVGTGDARAVKPLATYLVETLAVEDTLLAAGRELQQDGAKAQERVAVLDKELSYLRLKQKAGDRSVGPEIQKRVDEHSKLSRRFDEAREAMGRTWRTRTFLKELRARLVKGCSDVLAVQGGEAADRGLVLLHESLDVARQRQGLYLVAIIADSDLPHAEDRLLEILAHPKASAAVRRRAQYALAPRMTRKGATQMLKLWESDPEGGGVAARHVLGLAARRQFDDPAEARTWIESLDGK